MIDPTWRVRGGGIKEGRALEAVDLAELASSDDGPLEVVPVGGLEVEGAVVLLRVAVEGAEDVVAPARDARVANLCVRACATSTTTQWEGERQQLKFSGCQRIEKGVGVPCVLWYVCYRLVCTRSHVCGMFHFRL